MEGKLLIFSAPSGAGKSTVVAHLMQKFPALSFSISATSRKARKGELHARDYYFIPVEEFRHLIDNKAFIEWEEVYENQFYGTLKKEIDRIWAQGKHAVFDIDVAGGLNLKKQFGDQALAVFIQPPSLEVLEERLRGRGTDDEASLQKRLGKAGLEMESAENFDHILVNDKLENCLAEAEELIRQFLEI
ncbi:MAG: guanylate kinase [Bacteroidetes bacterium]|nr:MAG: guanylate kinase [Bacteroidota bacterium]